MFLFSPIHELSIVTVADPGVPNMERIVIRPTENVNLGQFGMAAGIRQEAEPNLVLPLTNSFFWFPSHVVEPPSWIFLYTGPGTTELTTLTGTSETAYVFHWGAETTIFQFREVVPILFRQAAILIGPNPSTRSLPKQPALPPAPTLPPPFAGLPRRRE
jgi:hypothetical protein